MASKYAIAVGQTSTGAQVPLKVTTDGKIVVSINDKGYYVTEAALLTAYPNGIATPSDRNGWYAIIGATDTVWIWDADTNAWIDSGSSGLVTSFNTRTGAVSPATNDYTWAQINKTTSDIADITTKSHTSLSDIGSNTHAQIDSILGALASTYAPAAEGVINGDSHDHNGGDGAQINHTTLSNIGNNAHSAIDTFISAYTKNDITLTDGATIAVDVSSKLNNNAVLASMAGDRALGAPSNSVQGARLHIRITADGTARVLTLNSVYKVGGGVKTINMPASSTVFISAICYDGTNWDASVTCGVA